MSKWTPLTDDDKEYLHQRRQYIKGLTSEFKEKNLEDLVSLHEKVSNHIKGILVCGGYYEEDLETLNALEVSASKH